MSAPEKIYMSEHTASREGFRKKYSKDDIEYIRSDLYDAALAECKRHEAAVERLINTIKAQSCPLDVELTTPQECDAKVSCAMCHYGTDWKAYAYKG